MITPKIEKVLRGGQTWPPPIWLMRQAGRYLPEYRVVRAKAGNFLNLCSSPELAAEVTLQPIKRFDLDAAIVFADILLIASALGQKLRFDDVHGPILEPAISKYGVGVLNSSGSNDMLDPVCQTIQLVRSELDTSKSVIGFCGGPWTVATYMVAGHSSVDQSATRLFAYKNPSDFCLLIDMLVEISAKYMISQAKAGANILKIFDSWAGVLPEMEFERWVIEPTRRLVEIVRANVEDVTIIGFPRGAGDNYESYLVKTGVDALALDTQISENLGRHLQEKAPIQGNLDPIVLEAGGEALSRAVDRVLYQFGSGPFVFNLGHGIGKNTPIDHVHELINRVRNSVDPCSWK